MWGVMGYDPRQRVQTLREIDDAIKKLSHDQEIPRRDMEFFKHRYRKGYIERDNQQRSDDQRPI